MTPKQTIILLGENSHIFIAAYLLVMATIDSAISITRKIPEHKLKMNQWLPFGVFIPVIWLLQIQHPSTKNVILVSTSGLFFVLFRPIIHRLHIRRNN